MALLRKMPLTVLLPLLGLLGCGGGSNPGPQAAATVLPTGPIIEGFSVSGQNAKEGSPSTLSWKVSGATRLTLEPGAIDVTGRTSLLVVAPGTTTYTLTAQSAEGTRSATATVNVLPADGPPVLELCGIQPTSTLPGGEVRLQWVAPTATSVLVEPGNLQTVLASSLPLKPTATTTYTITARNSRGTDVRRLTVDVLPAGSKPAIQTFGAGSAAVKAGSTVALTWSVQGADRLRLEPGGMEVTANSTCFVVPTEASPYRLVASNAHGEASATWTPTLTGTAPAQRFPHQQLLEDLRLLSAPDMEGRAVGSPGSLKAQAYLKGRMAALGLKPVLATYEQPWQRGGRSGVNLLGKLTGTTQPDKVIVIGGHYDHIGADWRGLVRPGADDNASGACAVLALAAWFQAHSPAHTLLFALFDGEETGLHGAYAFTEQPPVPLSQIQLYVNFDMVSRADYGKIGVAGTSDRPGLRPLVSAAAVGSPWAVEFGHEQYLKYSDQYPFYLKAIPYLWFFCVDHPDYHTWRDTYERHSPDYFRATVETALGSVIALDALPALPRAEPSLETVAPLAGPVFPITPEAWKLRALGRE